MLNAGAALWVGGIAENLRDAAQIARELLSQGAPLRKLEALIAKTRAQRAAL